MSQPLNQRETHPALGKLDRSLGEFWMENPWEELPENLSAYERNRVLWNVGKTRFVDISHATAADLDSDSRGVAIGDFNLDGRADVVVQSVGGGPLRCFENQWPQRSWLRVSLRGTRSNRLGLGSHIQVQAGDLIQGREVYPVISYRSQMPVAQLFGLGDANRIDRLTVVWPSGEETVLRDVPVNRHLRITEGSQEWETVVGEGKNAL